MVQWSEWSINRPSQSGMGHLKSGLLHSGLSGTSRHKKSPFIPDMGPCKPDIFGYFFTFLYLIVNLGPSPQNSAPNPMGFQFLIEGTWGSRKFGSLREEILDTPLPTN